jgi:hypothetical protein
VNWAGERKRLEKSVPPLKRVESNSLRGTGRACGFESPVEEFGSNARAMLRAIEVEFIDENGGGPGVRLAKRRSKKS